MSDFFDLAEQDQIRTCLLLYAQLHGIGVPRLSWRIVADNAARVQLPVKTLARFLAGKRVNDAAVAACAAFARTVCDRDTCDKVVIRRRVKALFLSANAADGSLE